MGWRDRLHDIAETIRGVFSGTEREEPPFVRAEMPTGYAFDYDRDIPPLGSLPPEPQVEPGMIDDLADMIETLGITDEFAMDLVERGWFDLENTSADERAWARDTFFEYTGMEEEEFSWDAWREWYGEAA